MAAECNMFSIFVHIFVKSEAKSTHLDPQALGKMWSDESAGEI